MVGISFIFILEKKVLPISTLISKLDKNIINIAKIGVNVYYTISRLKKAKILTISIKNLEFQAIKEAKLETNPKSVISKKYYDLLDVFSINRLKYTATSSKI